MDGAMACVLVVRLNLRASWKMNTGATRDWDLACSSVNERNELAHAAPVGPIVREFFDEPAFFAGGLELEENRKDRGITQGQPAMNDERPAKGKRDAASIHRVPDDPIDPRLHQCRAFLGIGERGEIGAEPEQSGQEQGAPCEPKRDTPDGCDLGYAGRPNGQSGPGSGAEENEDQKADLDQDIPFPALAPPPRGSGSMGHGFPFPCFL